LSSIPCNQEIYNLTQNVLALTEWLDIDFSVTRDQWATTIENIPGWYLVRTDTPTSVLEDLAHNIIKNNYRIAERTVENANVVAWELSCLPNDEGLTVVYNGEGKDVRARLCSHVFGGKGTGCLALKHKRYKSIRDFRWQVGWVYFRDVIDGVDDDEGIRVALEQATRGLIGWPILCYERRRRRIVTKLPGNAGLVAD
jgi:hypothetical protein